MMATSVFGETSSFSQAKVFITEELSFLQRMFQLG